MSTQTNCLKRGERVVYPAHGVGVIEGIEKIKTNGTSTSFYTIRIGESGMRASDRNPARDKAKRGRQTAPALENQIEKRKRTELA